MAYKMDKTLSKGAFDFIDAPGIAKLLSQKKEDKFLYREIFAKSLEKNPLTLDETASLLAIRSEEGRQELFQAARDLKRIIYGNRIVLFAPLYIGNLCINDCAYCGFKKSSKTTVRKTLTTDEIVSEVKALEDEGQKRLILVFGESPLYSPDFIAGCVRTVYSVRSGNGSIRRVNINAAPLDVAGYKTIKAEGIGTYQIFQETYHRESYAKYHPANTVKGDFMWRLDGLDRAFEAGIDDLGIGALIGLYDWRFEVMGLVSHAIHLKDKFGVGPHTISVPRICPADDIRTEDFPDSLPDTIFRKLVAVLRLAVPYTGMIVSTRESARMRAQLLECGVSQISGGSRTSVGGYTSKERHDETAQFDVADTRPLDDVVRWLLETGHIPSFCTACYREGRTGDRFMSLCKSGKIGLCCTPNALMTLKEYLVDYASAETRALGERMIAKCLADIPAERVRQITEKHLAEIENGSRDFRF